MHKNTPPRNCDSLELVNQNSQTKTPGVPDEMCQMNMHLHLCMCMSMCMWATKNDCWNFSVKLTILFLGSLFCVKAHHFVLQAHEFVFCVLSDLLFCFALTKMFLCSHKMHGDDGTLWLTVLFSGSLFCVSRLQNSFVSALHFDRWGNHQHTVFVCDVACK